MKIQIESETKTPEAQKQSYTVKILSAAKYFAKNIGDEFVSF